MDLDGLIEEAKKQISLMMLDGKLDTCEMVRVAVLLAEKMTVIENLSGKEKRKFVLHALDVAVKAAVPASQYEEEVSNFVKNMLPSMLDVAFDVARGRFSLLKPSVSCFAGVLSALGCSAQLKNVFDPVRKALPVAAAAEPVAAEPVSVPVAAPASVSAPVAAPVVLEETVAPVDVAVDVSGASVPVDVSGASVPVEEPVSAPVDASGVEVETQ